MGVLLQVLLEDLGEGKKIRSRRNIGPCSCSRLEDLGEHASDGARARCATAALSSAGPGRKARRRRNCHFIGKHLLTRLDV